MKVPLASQVQLTLVFFNVTDLEDENNILRTYQLVLASCLT